MSPALVLIGPMAAGKSRTGRRLAQRLNVPFLDTDRMVVEKHGPIADIFATQGEAVFREYEREAVVRALHSGGVIAFGGGAVLDERTQADLHDCAVVYLLTTAEVVAERLAGNTKRPLVADGGVERWQAIYDERRPIYERLGKIHIDTSRRPMEAIADELLAWYRSRYGEEA